MHEVLHRFFGAHLMSGNQVSEQTSSGGPDLREFNLRNQGIMLPRNILQQESALVLSPIQVTYLQHKNPNL